MFDLPVILKRKTHSRRHAKNKRILGRSIDVRPEIPANEYGHWEADTVIGRKCKGDAAVFTWLEKCSRNYIAIKIPSKDTDAVAYAMDLLRKQYGKRFKKIFKTITLDNGSEFDDFFGFEKWGSSYISHIRIRHGRGLRTSGATGSSESLFPKDVQSICTRPKKCFSSLTI